MLRCVLLAAALLVAVCEAVDVGEVEDSSCPNVTTVSIFGSSLSNSTKNSKSSSSSNSVQVTAASSCTSTTVKVATSSSGRRTLDLRKRSIEAVTSLPSVDVVRLDNNNLRAFSTDNNISELYLTNNSIPTLSDFEFPSTLTILDLANNDLGDIDGVQFSDSLQYLNLSGNSIGSLNNVTLPSKLLQLELADSSIASLENFSFPSTVTTLNFSNNPITTVRGVIFPDSLTMLTLIATARSSAAASTTSIVTPKEARRLQTVDSGGTATQSVLEEFEVRQTDANMFEQLKSWDVSTTSTLSCSDSNANPRYVVDTMLCVLSDSEFAAKYHEVIISASSGSTSSSLWGKTASSSQEEARIALKETFDQRRSWFLIGAAALLAGFAILMGVNAFCLCLRRKARGLSKAKSNQPTLSKTASGRPKNFWDDTGNLPPDDEVLHLLASDPLATVHEDIEQPESEQDGSGDSPTKSTSPLVYLQREIKRSRIDAGLIQRKTRLFSSDEDSGESVSPFVYLKAEYHRKAIVLKCLSAANRIEAKGGLRSSEMWSFVEEIRLYATLSHPQIVAFHGFSEVSAVPEHSSANKFKSLALAVEFMDKGDLNTFVQEHKRLLQQKQQDMNQRFTQPKQLRKGVSWQGHGDNYYNSDDTSGETTISELWSWCTSSAAYKSKLSIAMDVAQAVQYLHSFSPPLFHGNLSSRKVFLDRDWNVKLGDLTCCSALRRWSSSHKQSSNASSPDDAASKLSEGGRSTSSEIPMDMSVWTAPEVLDGRQYTQKADIYSFGILLAQLNSYECSSAEHSVMDDTEVPMLNNAGQDNPSEDGEAPTPIRLLMFRCQAFQPEVRPTAEELLCELRQIQRGDGEAKQYHACR